MANLTLSLNEKLTAARVSEKYSAPNSPHPSPASMLATQQYQHAFGTLISRSLHVQRAQQRDNP